MANFREYTSTMKNWDKVFVAVAVAVAVSVAVVA